ncbi:MAG: hypothetical protein Q8J71_09430 [Brevundimonas sp.]|nr:hypothetical protein [Brevundimonas sp.]
MTNPRDDGGRARAGPRYRVASAGSSVPLGLDALPAYAAADKKKVQFHEPPP